MGRVNAVHATNPLRTGGPALLGDQENTILLLVLSTHTNRSHTRAWTHQCATGSRCPHPDTVSVSHANSQHPNRPTTRSHTERRYMTRLSKHEYKGVHQNTASVLSFYSAKHSAQTTSTSCHNLSSLFENFNADLCGFCREECFTRHGRKISGWPSPLRWTLRHRV